MKKIEHSEPKINISKNKFTKNKNNNSDFHQHKWLIFTLIEQIQKISLENMKMQLYLLKFVDLNILLKIHYSQLRQINNPNNHIKIWHIVRKIGFELVPTNAIFFFIAISTNNYVCLSDNSIKLASYYCVAYDVSLLNVDSFE